MGTLSQATLLLASVGAGLVAGLCFAFWSFLMRSFDRLGPSQAVRVMQSVNSTILSSTAMGAWMGTVVLGAVGVALTEARALAAASLVAYAAGALAITRAGNIPLNLELDAVDPSEPDAEAAWRRYYQRWGRWNALRTVACALGSAGFALAAGA